MTRFYSLALGSLFAVATALCIAGCNSAGGFASFSSTAQPAQKIDWAVTVKNTCVGLKASVAVVDAVSAGDPKILGNDANVAVYAKVKQTVLDTCGQTPPADLATAEANLLLASTDLGALYQTLKANGVIK